MIVWTNRDREIIITKINLSFAANYCIFYEKESQSFNNVKMSQQCFQSQSCSIKSSRKCIFQTNTRVKTQNFYQFFSILKDLLALFLKRLILHFHLC